MSVDGSKRRSVLALPGAGVIRNVRWSPDGRRLAFVLQTSTPASVATWGAVGHRSDIYVINSDGSGLRPVAPVHTSDAGQLEWSPDATRLAFVSDANGIAGIYTVAADGPSVPSRVSPSHVVSTNPRWSHDGTSIGFTGTSVLPVNDLLGEAPAVWIVDADGSDVRRLPARSHHAPAWSPDGRWLAYSCIEEGCGINVIRADGRVGRTLTGAPRTSDSWPIWSRHGKIAFVRSDDGSCCSRTLWVMDGDGSNQRQLVGNASSVEFGVAWSE